MVEPVRRTIPVGGLVVEVLGVLVVALGAAYGWNCDFDTMDVCRPFNAWPDGSFAVEGTAGLLILTGIAAMILGAAWIIFGMLHGRFRA